MYQQTQPYRNYEKENPNPRKITAPTKTQESNNPHQHNPKKGNTQTLPLKNIQNKKPLVLNTTQYQWTQFTNTRTQAKRMDTKTGSNLLLFTRNIPQP